MWPRKKLYWAFHAVLFVAFAVTALGFGVEGPRQYWRHTFDTRFGPIGFENAIHDDGTTILFGPGEFTIGFELYALITFSVAALLFAVAGALGLRLTLNRHEYDA